MTHRSYGRWYLRHGPVYCIGHARCIGRLTQHACPSTRTPAARQRPRGGVGSCRDPGPAGLPAGWAIRHRRRDHDARPARDRDQRRGVATGGTRTRHLPDGRGAGCRLAPAAAAVDRRRAQPAAGAGIADVDAVARGRVSVAARAGGDKPLRRFRPRPPAGRRDRAPATAAACRDRVGGRVHGACRYRVHGRRDRQRARVARPDDTTRGLAIRADRCRGRAPAMRRRPGCRQERPAHRPPPRPDRWRGHRLRGPVRPACRHELPLAGLRRHRSRARPVRRRQLRRAGLDSDARRRLDRRRCPERPGRDARPAGGQDGPRPPLARDLRGPRHRGDRGRPRSPLSRRRGRRDVPGSLPPDPLARRRCRYRALARPAGLLGLRRRPARTGRGQRQR